MNEIELNYKGMHEQLSKAKRDSKEIRNQVILCSTSLEFAVTQLVKIGAEKLNISSFKKIMTKSFVPIIRKIGLLRTANIINKDIQENLTILFGIRNKFAHELFLISKDTNPVFEPLKNIHTTNSFLKNLPNDLVKFQLTTSKCFAELVTVSKSLDPSSVLELEVVGDITPIEE